MEQEFMRGIYAIECSDTIGSTSKWRLLYSPFNENMSLASEEEWIKLKQKLSKNDSIDNDLSLLINDQTIDEVRDLRIDSVKDVVKLSILPTNKCNFACSYCYSREGRDATQVSISALNRTLEFFINPERTNSKELTISYLGGGEPMLCWDTFKHSLDYSNELAKKYGFKLMNSVNTNGSILNDEILTYLKKYDVTVCVTFEVFEDIQNTQRGQWNIVKENIKTMLEKGIRVIISSIITPFSVNRLPELVSTIVSEYRGVRTLILEPVVDMASSSFSSLEEIYRFYQNYTNQFFDALPIAEKNEVRLLNSVIRKMWRKHIRFCDGEISLTAMGTISGCTSVSSPREVHYSDYCYGDARKETIYIDKEKFEGLLNRNVFSYTKCDNCFLKCHFTRPFQFRNFFYSFFHLLIVFYFNIHFALIYLIYI
ncbi:radical SAM protein, partial [Phocaeicola barnesiae]|uniref:radical SAM protein n=1 Tax=Phocaeicola barnesiae TaxID=376804 RepID=UPI001F28CBB4